MTISLDAWYFEIFKIILNVEDYHKGIMTTSSFVGGGGGESKGIEIVVVHLYIHLKSHFTHLLLLQSYDPTAVT